MLAAIKEANSSEGKMIMDKLHSMEFSGALGKVKLTKRGCDNSALCHLDHKDGKFAEYWKP